MRARTALIAIGGTIALTIGGSAAYATVAAGPVSSSGVVSGCFTNAEVNGSHALVLQDTGTTCPKGTTAVSWNEQGPAGPVGPAGAVGATGPAGPAGPAGATGSTGPAGVPGSAGANGTNGTNGTSLVTSSGDPTSSCTSGDTDINLANGEVYSCSTESAWVDTMSSIEGAQGPAGTGATVSSLAAGDTNCPHGGTQVTDGSGDTAYACNGATGATGAAGSSDIDGGVVEDSSDGTCTALSSFGPDTTTVSYYSDEDPRVAGCLISGLPANSDVQATPTGVFEPGAGISVLTNLIYSSTFPYPPIGTLISFNSEYTSDGTVIPDGSAGGEFSWISVPVPTP
jgi:hypothetical protein